MLLFQNLLSRQLLSELISKQTGKYKG